MSITIKREGQIFLLSKTTKGFYYFRANVKQCFRDEFLVYGRCKVVTDYAWGF